MLHNLFSITEQFWYECQIYQMTTCSGLHLCWINTYDTEINSYYSLAYARNLQRNVYHKYQITEEGWKELDASCYYWLIRHVYHGFNWYLVSWSCQINTKLESLCNPDSRLTCKVCSEVDSWNTLFIFSISSA